MYKVLRDKMKEKKVTNKDIAEFLNKREATISDKINGKYPFTLDESLAIRNKFFKGESIETLFIKDEEKKHKDAS